MRRNKKLYLGLGLLGLVSFFLTPMGQVVATKISDLTAMTVDQIADPSSVFVLATDAQSGNTSKKIPLDQLGLATELKLVTATSHGFTSGDVGKPLYGSVEFDDTSGTTYPTWVLAGVVDANTLLVAGDGAQVTIDVGLLDGGNTYDVGTSGYSVYWDASAGEYTAALPADSKYVDHVLLITKVDTTDFDAIVVGKGGLEETNAVVVRGSGVAATDNTNFANAITTLEANGDSGVIYISGTVNVTSTHSISEAISLKGVPGTAPQILFNENAYIGWNPSYSPFASSSTSVSGVGRGDSTFVLPSGTLAAGDWFYITAEDDIEGVLHHNRTDVSSSGTITGFTASESTDKITKTSHGLDTGDAVCIRDAGAGVPGGLYEDNTYWVIGATANDFQVAETRGGSAIDITVTRTCNIQHIYGYWPGELHQVKELRNPVTPDGNDYYVIDDIFCDEYTTNARVYKVDMVTGIRVEDLSLAWTGSSVNSSPALYFKRCKDVRVDNVHWEHDGPNEISAIYCANVVLSNLSSENIKGYDEGNGYATIAGSCNGFLLCDSIFRGHRHAFTTTETDNGYARIGSTRNTKIDNVTAITAGAANSSLISFDTHCEGWGIEFSNCNVIIPADTRNPSAASPTANVNYAFQSRSRDTIFRNCTVKGNGTSYGIVIGASNNKVLGCDVDESWLGIVVRDVGYNQADGAVIKDNHLHNVHGPAIQLSKGQGHTITGNSFDQCSGYAYSIAGAALINIDQSTDDVTNVTITHNQLDRRGLVFTADSSTDVITVPGHYYKNGDRVRVGSTSALPGGMSASSVYYVYNVDQKAGTLQLTTSVNSVSPINITTAGTGTHTLFSTLYAVGGTSFDADDIQLFGNSMTGYAGFVSGLTTDSGFNSSNADAVNLQAEADSHNWTD